jgi:hypothetical protein
MRSSDGDYRVYVRRRRRRRRTTITSLEVLLEALSLVREHVDAKAE